MLFVNVLRVWSHSGSKTNSFWISKCPTLCKRESCSLCLYCWAPASLEAALGLPPSLGVRQLHLDCALQDLGSDFIGTMISEYVHSFPKSVIGGVPGWAGQGEEPCYPSTLGIRGFFLSPWICALPYIHEQRQ